MFLGLSFSTDGINKNIPDSQPEISPLLKTEGVPSKTEDMSEIKLSIVLR